MKNIIHQAISLSLFFLSLVACGQETERPKEIQERYYSEEMEVGRFDPHLEDSLAKANRDHPAVFYMLCGSFIEDSMMNEAAVAYYIGRSRFRLYNGTNPKFELSGDGALESSLNFVYAETLSEYLTSNLENYGEIVRYAGEWYEEHKHFYFDHPSNDSIYQVQTNAILAFSKELLEEPDKQIEQLETQRTEMEEAIKKIRELIEKSESDHLEE